MTDNSPIAFWSYTHRDDTLDNGRIRRLAEAISNEYEIQTGEPLILFIDSSDIKWGDIWKKTIDDALIRTAFFIPIITPLYLKSEQCRREFVEFVGRATSLSARDLVLPILYSHTSEVENPDTTDDVARICQEVQREDWRELRLADEESTEYRTAVNRLARRLVALAIRFDEEPPAIDIDELADDFLGPLDLMAQSEEVISGLQPIFEGLSAAAAATQTVMKEATAALHESDRRGGGARGRLVVAQQFAANLAEPAEQLFLFGTEFGRSAVEADAGVQVVIRATFAEEFPEEDIPKRDELVQTIKTFVETTSSIAASIQGFNPDLVGLQALARVMRTPVRQMRAGLSAIVDGATVINGWSDLLDDLASSSA